MTFIRRNRKIPRSQLLEKSTEKNGWRRFIFNTVGDKYAGQWTDNLKEGKGTLLTRHRDLYEGDFHKNRREGFGVLSHVPKEPPVPFLSYRGDWKGGRMHGWGIRRYPEGGVYIGEWQRGKRHGYGMMWYGKGRSDDIFYAGDWRRDQREGLGMLVRVMPNLDRYEGNWLADKKHGKGRYLHLKSGQMQEGVWREGWCVFCTFRDLYWRQSAVTPTMFPIQKIELLDMENLCEERELKALSDFVHSCLSIHETLSLDASL